MEMWNVSCWRTRPWGGDDPLSALRSGANGSTHEMEDPAVACCSPPHQRRNGPVGPTDRPTDRFSRTQGLYRNLSMERDRER
ncbi:hypothetical protein AGOR_G00046230 [Albula goreensis]|uniref:Uncharacterized protein n=1 Tax=Albula goreensis TaxID=1534307 RepID=A0A8T3DZH3_9TELE|nr:hypothetical protein AGOR_G00046230 [Albula goreensis]